MVFRRKFEKVMIVKNPNIEKATTVMLVAALAMVAFNAIQIGQLGSLKSDIITGQVVSGNAAAGNAASGSNALASAPDVIPKGVPEIYGKELGVSYDDVSAANLQKAESTIQKLGVLDNQISLTGDALNRYKETLIQISCEYCCGADSIIFSNGQAACSCAHSYAMRGLAKYLLKNHAGEYTNDQILEELGKWKTLFFPGQITQKASVLQQKGVELNYINLASNKYRGIEAGASGSGQVGGC